MRRVAPMKPSTYSGMNAAQKPPNQHENAHLPKVSLSLKPNAFGNQYVKSARNPNTTPPIIALWKCAIKNTVLWSTKPAPGTASSTPVSPPTVKVIMKPIVHNTGDENCSRPL